MSLFSGVLIHGGGYSYVVYMSFTMGGRVSRLCLLFPLNWQCVTNLASHNDQKIACCAYLTSREKPHYVQYQEVCSSGY